MADINICVASSRTAAGAEVRHAHNRRTPRGNRERGPMRYQISGQNGEGAARRETATEAVNKAIELVRVGVPGVISTDLTSGRVYRQDEFSLLQAEARMRLERGS